MVKQRNIFVMMSRNRINVAYFCNEVTKIYILQKLSRNMSPKSRLCVDVLISRDVDFTARQKSISCSINEHRRNRFRKESAEPLEGNLEESRYPKEAKCPRSNFLRIFSRGLFTTVIPRF